jgi:hypothetical protein
MSQREKLQSVYLQFAKIPLEMSEAFLDCSPLDIILSGIIERIREPSHRSGSPLREQSF